MWADISPKTNTNGRQAHERCWTLVIGKNANQNYSRYLFSPLGWLWRQTDQQWPECEEHEAFTHGWWKGKWIRHIRKRSNKYSKWWVWWPHNTAVPLQGEYTLGRCKQTSTKTTNADTHSSTNCNRQKLKRLKTPSRDFHEQNVRHSHSGICLMVRRTKWRPTAWSQGPLRALPGFTKTTQSMMSLRWNIQRKPLDKKKANKVPRTKGMFSEGIVTASTCLVSVQSVKKFY